MKQAFWLGVAAAAVVVGLSGYGLHSISINMLERDHMKQMAAQKTALAEKCDADKAITLKVSNDYQNKVDSLNRKLAAARRMHERDACISVLAGSRSGSDEAGKPAKLLRQGNEGTAPERTVGYITYGSFIDLMAEGQTYQDQASSCQQFVTAVQEQYKNGRKKK